MDFGVVLFKLVFVREEKDLRLYFQAFDCCHIITKVIFLAFVYRWSSVVYLLVSGWICTNMVFWQRGETPYTKSCVPNHLRAAHCEFLHMDLTLFLWLCNESCLLHVCDTIFHVSSSSTRLSVA